MKRAGNKSKRQQGKASSEKIRYQDPLNCCMLSRILRCRELGRTGRLCGVAECHFRYHFFQGIHCYILKDSGYGVNS